MKICTNCNRHFYDNLVDSTIVDGNLICEVCFHEQFGRTFRPTYIKKPAIDTTKPHFMGGLNVPNRWPYRVGDKTYGEVSVPAKFSVGRRGKVNVVPRKFGSERNTYYPKADSYSFKPRDWKNVQYTNYWKRDRSAVEW